MDEKKLLEVARGTIQAFNERDWNRFRALLAPNCVYDEVGTGRKTTGRDEVITAARGWTEAFSDMRGQIGATTTEKDTVVLQVDFRGTHDGPLPGPDGPINPTRKKTTTRCCQVLRVSDGLVVEHRNYFDMLGLLQAIGAIPVRQAKRAGA